MRTPSFMVGPPPTHNGSTREKKGPPRGRDVGRSAASPLHEVGRRRPGVDELLDLLKGGLGVRSVAFVGLFLLALLFVVRVARPFLLPVVVALLFALMLRPVVRALRRLRVPEILGSALVLAAFLGTVGYGVAQLIEPASRWMEEAPGSLERAERKLRGIRAPVENVSKAAEEVERITRVDAREAARSVEVRGPGFSEVLLSGTRRFIAAAVVVVVLLYFLLAYGDLFLRKAVRAFPRFAERRRAVEIARDSEKQISVYLSTVTLINAGLGLAVGLAMAALDMPNPVLWGVMAGLLNYVPYLGAIVGIGVVTLVAMLTFDDIGRALIPPLSYLVLTALEGQFITPMILGRRLRLNPVMIFLWLVFWGWMWGVPGALVAVPMLAAFKIVCDRVESLRPVGDFLGR